MYRYRIHILYEHDGVMIRKQENAWWKMCCMWTPDLNGAHKYC